MAKALLTDAQILDQLQKWTKTGPNPSQIGKLIQAIRSGIKDFEVDYTEEKYPQHGLEPGDVFTHRERMDMERRVYHSIREAVAMAICGSSRTAPRARAANGRWAKG